MPSATKFSGIVTLASSIQSGQRTPNNDNSPATLVSWTIKGKAAVEHERDWVGKYAPYFQGNTILPIPDLVAAVEPKTLSLIVTDLRTRRLAGLKKESSWELLKTAGIPCRYFCRRSYATWDVLQPSEDLASKLAGNNITTKYFRLQPEYRRKQAIRVTVYNVPIQLNGDVLAAYLSKYGCVEAVTPPK